MSVQYKSYKFRMRPTKVQRQYLNQVAGARRWVYNWALNRRREYYRDFGKTISYNALVAELTRLKYYDDFLWLTDIPAQVLQQAIRDVCQAFTRFFQKLAGFPRFKSRKTDKARFRAPQNVRVDGNSVFSYKLGYVPIYKSREITEKIKNATFKRDSRGNWYVSLLVEFELPDVSLPPFDPDKVVGIDLGLIDFTTLSDDTEPVPVPKFYRRGERKLKRLQRKLSRAIKGSKRRDKVRQSFARAHEKIRNQRSDFIHKETTKLVRNYDGLCIEDLCVKGLARTKLAKSIHDASFGEFRRQVEYKTLWNYKRLAVVDQYFPSSKMCSVCGEINNDLTLSDRVWECSCCGELRDRDKNAAINIRYEGLRILTAGQSGSLNARGDCVKPSTEGNDL